MSDTSSPPFHTDSPTDADGGEANPAVLTNSLVAHRRAAGEYVDEAIETVLGTCCCEGSQPLPIRREAPAAVVDYSSIRLYSTEADRAAHVLCMKYVALWRSARPPRHETRRLLRPANCCLES